MIQHRTADDGAFGPENVVWSDIEPEPRWATLVGTPPGIGPTRMNKTYDRHRRKKKSGFFLVFRKPFTVFDGEIGYSDVRFVDTKTNTIYVMDNSVDWTPGAYPTHFISIPVIIAPEEQAIG